MEYKGYTFTVERDGMRIEKCGRLVIIQLQQLPRLGLNTFEDAIVYFNSIPQSEAAPNFCSFPMITHS